MPLSQQNNPMPLQKVNHGVVVADRNGTIRFVNQRAAEVFGVDDSSCKGRPVSCLVRRSTNEPLLEGLFKSLTIPGQTVAQNLELDSLTTPGEPLCLAVTGICLEDTTQAVLAEAKQGTKELEQQNLELIHIKESLEAAYAEINTELDMAKQIQESILPASLPKVPGYEFAFDYTPTGKVGGDYYDIALLDKHNLLILQADVSGHGVPAAFVTAMAKIFFDHHIRADVSLYDALVAMNADFCDNIKTEHSITAFIGILNLKSGVLNYSRICHPYPIVFRSQTNTVEFLTQRGGFFLGMMKQSNDFFVSTTELNQGDKLLVYTDGLNEGFNVFNRQYGRERLADSVHRYGQLSVKDLLSSILKDRESFMNGEPNHDDVTAIVVARK